MVAMSMLGMIKSHDSQSAIEVFRVSNAHRVGRRAVLGHLHLLRTVGSRARLLGGVCTRMPKYKINSCS